MSFISLTEHKQIFPKLKAIFVHVPKTAGTSIEQTLCEPGRKVGGHTTAAQFKNYFPAEFESYFKFAFVRHPLSRFLSAYAYLRSAPVYKALNNAIVHKCHSPENLAALLLASPEKFKDVEHFRPQHFYLCDDQSVLLVKVFRFEQIEKEWQTIQEKLDIRRPLPRLNPSRKPVSTPALIPLIRQIYKRDFELFGYTL